MPCKSVQWEELFDVDGQNDRHDEANSRFSQFCESAQKEKLTWSSVITPNIIPLNFHVIPRTLSGIYYYSDSKQQLLPWIAD